MGPESRVRVHWEVGLILKMGVDSWLSRLSPLVEMS